MKMNLLLNEKDERHSKIIRIVPLKHSYQKIVLFVIVVVALMCLVGFLVNPKISMVIFMSLCFLILELMLSHNVIKLKLFYESTEEAPEVKLYAVYDQSNMLDFSQNPRKNDKRAFIVSPHYVYQGVKFIRHKGSLYQIKDGNLQSLEPQQILAYLDIHTLEGVQDKGLLTPQTAERSKGIFGIGLPSLKESIFKFLWMRVRKQKEFYFFMIVSLLVSYYLNLLTFLIIIFIYCLVFIFVFITQKKSLKVYNDAVTFAETVTYSVIRNGQCVKVRLQQLFVGDVVKLKESLDSDSNDIDLYFQGILTGGNLFVSELASYSSDKPTLKSSLLDTAYLGERNIVHSQTRVARDQITDRSCLIVLQNEGMRVNFQLWQQRQVDPEYSSLLNKYLIEMCIFGATLFSIMVLFHIIFTVFSSQSHKIFDLNRFYFQTLLIVWVKIPATIYILVIITEIISRHKLVQIGVELMGSGLMRSALITQAIVEFSGLVELNYQDVLYKIKIFNENASPFQCDAATVQHGNEYESFLALVLYTSMGHFEAKHTFLRKLYNMFAEEFHQNERMTGYSEIEHGSTSKTWTLLRLLEMDEKQLKTWVINYNDRNTFVITQGDYNSNKEEFKSLMAGAQDNSRVEQYVSTADEMVARGKIVKFVNFKKVIQNQLRERLHDESQLVDRQELQNNLEFGGFVIFDYAISRITLQTIESLMHPQNQLLEGINFTFVSAAMRQQVAGFEHIMLGQVITFGFSSIDKIRLVRQRIFKENNCLYVGWRLADQPAQRISDISVIQTRQAGLKGVYGPADLYLTHLKDIAQVMAYGKWVLERFCLSVKNVMLVTMCQTFGLLFLNSRIPELHKDNTQIPEIVISSLFWIFLILIPCILLNLAPLKDVSAKPKQSYVDKIVLLQFGLLLILQMIIYVAAFDPSSSLCRFKPLQAPNKHHLLSRHLFPGGILEYTPNRQCEISVYFLIISFAVIIHSTFEDKWNWIFKWGPRTSLKEQAPRIYMITLWIISVLVLWPELKLIIIAVVLFAIAAIMRIIIAFLDKNSQSNAAKLRSHETSANHQINDQIEQVEQS